MGLAIALPDRLIRKSAIDQIPNPAIQANLSAASAILAGLRLEDEIIYRVLRRDIMQESSVYRSIQRKAQVEEKRAIALSSLREGLPIEVGARITGLSSAEVQQLQQQLDEAPQS